MMISVTIANFTDFHVVFALSIIMLVIGLFGLTSKKSGIKIIMSIEILVSATNLAFIAYGFGYDNAPITESYVILSLAVGACVVGLALAILRHIYQHFKTVNVEKFATLKW